ncbi:hypothetical protein DD829_09365 [Chryseobacterium sp. HMWF035]|nr:hypothetical protein DBR25_03600 [Chryseobacterium sp. HMWF001]PVV57022.1 hypothetical protein DD829_09365 [Chryseobacterium sp. HMWF035]
MYFSKIINFIKYILGIFLYLSDKRITQVVIFSLFVFFKDSLHELSFLFPVICKKWIQIKK